MMNPRQILTSDVLDIVFEGRNKEYGAYQLRKNYQGRLGLSVGLVITTSLALFYLTSLNNPSSKGAFGIVPADTITLIPPPVKKPKSPEPTQVEKRVAQVHFTEPLIVKNEFFRGDTVPSHDEIIPAEISKTNVDGVLKEGDAPSTSYLPIVSPSEKPSGPVIFDHPEIPAHFPGGTDAWKRYLERNLEYPEMAIANEKQGTVRLQFVVDTGGNISEVVTLSDPGDGLGEEATRIISRGPKWIPAEQGGQKVISRHIQTITFRLN